MIRAREPRVLRRFAIGLLITGGSALSGNPAAAQGVPPFTGFASLPAFAWTRPAPDAESRWAGSYAAISTGFSASSSKHFGGYAGPTLGFEGGRMWQEGRLVYGVVGGFDYLAAVGGNATPGFGRLAYARDFAGAQQVKVGAHLTPPVRR